MDVNSLPEEDRVKLMKTIDEVQTSVRYACNVMRASLKGVERYYLFVIKETRLLYDCEQRAIHGMVLTFLSVFLIGLVI